jgi:lipoate---protein ligase
MYYIENQNITDPAVNLALEEYAVRFLDKRKSYVLFYINEPSIILGKYQNVFEEVNLLAADRQRIPVYRRISGGGTVFHDPGNLNFSYICQHTLKLFNTYNRFLQPIAQILKEGGADVSIDQRNNLRIGSKKISGNAQFTSRNRLLSHGTLLFNSDLDRLNAFIKDESVAGQIISKSTKSQRSSVTNVKFHLQAEISLDELRQKFIQRIFKNHYQEQSLSRQDWQEIQDLAESKYRTWDWNYGQSPPCRMIREFQLNQKLHHLVLDIKEGSIKDIQLQGPFITKSDSEWMGTFFVGSRFDVTALAKVFVRVRADNRFKHLQKLNWKTIIFK